MVHNAKTKNYEKDIDYGGQWLYWWFPGEGGA